jgi:DNA-binding Lrp family transcriptional regulator
MRLSQVNLWQSFVTESADVKRPGPPKGSESYAIDEVWKTAVRAALDERGMSQKELGDKIGLTEGGVSRTLKPLEQDGPRRSAYALKISNILGVSLPRQKRDPRAEEVLDALEEVREASPAVFEKLATEAIKARDEMRRLLRRTPPKRTKPNNISG